jgi:hypothetical protein
VLEGYAPDATAVARLLEGKARDFRVRPTDLLSEEQVLNSIFTRILETDFLPQDKREEILKRLTSAIIEAGKEPLTRESSVESEPVGGGLVSRTVALGMMGFLASLVGSMVVAFPRILNLDSDFPRLFPAMAVTVVASVAVITVLIAFYRFRESQREEMSKGLSFAGAREFERDVANLLAKAGVEFQVPAADAGYDFRITRGSREILLELKLNPRMPTRLIAHLAERLRQALAKEGASEAIIVTPIKPDVPREVTGQHVSIMTPRELRSYLMHGEVR